ncbi:peptide ABC transporter ATP-binding protein [Alicyclobacillus cellulosilyticus]|uniref:Peptide ABC transporter ATP-binding protein n=1 Tax=Alicyclobacillus cellulosilyticus TaxID=1003997 RepID=A0A917NG36_9BACL|nr:ABC transporter ATP-binding protein [Alicyclobacillus cellulosilyticus]GGI98524.1 peptide ABC transporter ATP-binding protein [Alicyclobacillus cellulosilyticus]
MADALLTVENLAVEFQRNRDRIYAVNGVSFSIAPGEALGIVGESGSGKSVTLLSVLGLIAENGRITSGSAVFQGRDLLKLRRRELEEIRGRDIGMIFQNPMTSLNPVMRVGDQIMEVMLTHHVASPKEAYRRTIELLEEMGIPEPEVRFRNYPHEFSGGMRQRIMIAIAIACNPQLLIADEPTTALDVTVQMQILSLLRDLRQTKGMAVALITHDFGVAANFCDRLIVMYAGSVVEVASRAEFIRRPMHPYTLALKESIIEVGHRHREVRAIPGMAPVLTSPPNFCAFADRCPFAIDRCRNERPQLRSFGNGHGVACHRAEEVLELVH